MPKTLAQWLDHIQGLHTRSIDLSLERVNQVWQRFKPSKLPVIVAVAGTNGKGSSINMLAAVYHQADYQCGVYTSPHLVHFNERFLINDKPVSDKRLLAAFSMVEKHRQDVPITFFEFSTLLALQLFSESKLDVWLMEVGLGGRLDAVNILHNDLALITSISIDHAAWLGNDREKIGFEKAGIIKQNGKAVIADPQPPASLVQTAKAQKANTLIAGQDYSLKPTPEPTQKQAKFMSEQYPASIFNATRVNASLTHVQNNTAGVIAAVSLLNNRLAVTAKQLTQGLNVGQQTLRGRLQLIKGAPQILLDVSHNEDSMLALLEYIDSLTIKGSIHAVFGALADKSFAAAIQPLKARIDTWYVSSLDNERGQSASALAEQIFPDGISAERNNPSAPCVHLFDTPISAFKQARSAAKKADLIVIFGSFHLVGAILPVLKT